MRKGRLGRRGGPQNVREFFQNLRLAVYLIGKIFFEADRCLLLDRLWDLGIADGVRDTLTAFVLHDVVCWYKVPW